MRFPEYKIQKNTQRKRTEMAAKIKKEITALSLAKNDQETLTKDEENENSIKSSGTILDKIFVDFFIFQHNFSSPQVKRNQIIIIRK